MNLTRKIIATISLSEEMTLQEIWHSILEMGYHAEKAEMIDGVAHITFGDRRSDDRICKAN